jgi:vitamin B12 transporter
MFSARGLSARAVFGAPVILCFVFAVASEAEARSAESQRQGEQRSRQQEEQRSHQSTDTVVVTGRRASSKRSETPQAVEVVTSEDLDRTIAQDVTDALKKNGSVDVVQYNGLLSGIGIRGFRPEFERTINKRSLVLIDGRPVGSANLAMITLDNVDRIEVQKGPSSALYGPSAMGGVVNLITRRPDRDKWTGSFSAGYGSFESRELAARSEAGFGGDGYYSVSVRRLDQQDDYDMGGGQTRPFTSYETNHVTARIGHGISDAWTLEGSAVVHWDRDVLLPGSELDGTSQQARKDQDQHSAEMRLLGDLGAHQPALVLYTTREAGNNITVTSLNAAEQPFLPYLSFDFEIRELGVQLRDEWQWSPRHSLLIGLDHQDIELESRSYNPDGSARAPFSPDNARRTTGVFVQDRIRLRDGQTIFELGARYDRNDVSTRPVPLRPTFTPSDTRIDRFSPSIGFKQELTQGVRLHVTAGSGFVVPEAGQLTGRDERIVGGRPQITLGNPDLKAESSVAYDVGLEWTAEAGRMDFTYFDTRVKDRITGVTLANPLPTAPADQPVVNSFTNANDADIQGIELDAEWQATSALGVFLNANHFFERRETVAGVERDIRNVAKSSARAGVDYRRGAFSGRLSARYVGERKAQNFNLAGAPEVTYPTFVTVDLTLRYSLSDRHMLSLDAANLFDRLYYETLGYNLAGRSFFTRYRYSFR